MGTDIELVRSAPQQFPPICIGCGQANPDRTMKFRGLSITWWTGWAVLYPLAFLSWKPGLTVEVPTCSACKTRLTRQRRYARPALAAALALLVGVVAAPLLGAAATGAAMLLLMVVEPWEMVFPRPIKIVVLARKVEYEFEDPVYAQEFARFNGVPALAEDVPT